MIQDFTKPGYNEGFQDGKRAASQPTTAIESVALNQRDEISRLKKEVEELKAEIERLMKECKANEQRIAELETEEEALHKAIESYAKMVDDNGA